MATENAPENKALSDLQAANHILQNFDSASCASAFTSSSSGLASLIACSVSCGVSSSVSVDSGLACASSTPPSNESEDDDSEESVDFNLENLARHLNVEVDDLYEMQLPIKVNGEESQAQLRELVKNYQLESAINQKSMKLSEQLKQTENEREQIRRERELYQSQLTPFLQQLNQLVDQDNQVDWEKLSQDDPQ